LNALEDAAKRTFKKYYNPRMKSLRVTLSDDLASWLKEAARKAGVSRERFIRIELERARKMSMKPFLR
jgi:hypothetical protein